MIPCSFNENDHRCLFNVELGNVSHHTWFMAATKTPAPADSPIARARALRAAARRKNNERRRLGGWAVGQTVTGLTRDGQRWTAVVAPSGKLTGRTIAG